MNKIFKWFTVTDDREALVRTLWFTNLFEPEDFKGVDEVLFLFLRYCADLDVPALKQYLESFLRTEGKKNIKQFNIRLETMDMFRYDEPASFEEACRVITAAVNTAYDEYSQMVPLANSSFKVDMRTFMEERKANEFQMLMAETFPRTQNGDDLTEVMSDFEMKFNRIQELYDLANLDELDFMMGNTRTEHGVKKMRKLFTTGIPCIDGDIGGMYSKQLWSFTGGPGTGKTRFAIAQFVYRALVHAKIDVLMFELELSEEEIRNMLIAHHIVYLYGGKIKISDSTMNKNEMTPEQKRYYEAAKIDLFESGKYGQLHLRTDDLILETMQKNVLNFLKHNRNTQLVVIDYAGLVESKPVGKYDKRYDGYEIIQEVYKRSKRIAKKADVGFLIINQFNDEGNKASAQGKRILPGMVQGGQIVSRHADYDLAMTMTDAQELAKMRMLSTVKKRAATGFQKVPIGTDLAISMFRQQKAEAV